MTGWVIGSGYSTHCPVNPFNPSPNCVYSRWTRKVGLVNFARCGRWAGCWNGTVPHPWGGYIRRARRWPVALLQLGPHHRSRRYKGARSGQQQSVHSTGSCGTHRRSGTVRPSDLDFRFVSLYLLFTLLLCSRLLHAIFPALYI